MNTDVSIDHLERLVFSRAYDAAVTQLERLFEALQTNEKISASGIAHLPLELQRARICTRAAGAVSALFADSAFRPNPAQVKSLFTHHSWFGTIFAATPFGNADHIIRTLNPRGPDDKHFLAGDSFVEKLCLLYSIQSDVVIDLDALWRHDSLLAAKLAVALVASPFLGTQTAYLKRETLLKWLPEKLAQIRNLDDLAPDILPAAYMHCSYADLPERHAIKKGINLLVRRKLDQIGWSSPVSPARPKRPKRSKPLMIVVVEWFTRAHSIYRTHSRTLEAARQHFEVVGFGFPDVVDDAGRAIFDQFIELGEQNDIVHALDTIRKFAAARQPDVLYMPSVGMFVLTVFMANLRVAPLQIAALGHPATTHSDMIDYISVEEDFVGDPACFSEKLLTLPKDGQPYIARARPDFIPGVPPRREAVHVIVTSTPMKLNPRFLDACRRIVENAGIPVQVHFMTVFPAGLRLVHIAETIRQIVPGAIVHGEHDYPSYLRRVHHADLFLSPFPFGNTNGIIDAFSVGVPGVCKTGAEVFEHIDGALFARAEMPAWTTTHSVDDYVEAAVRMITQHDEREALRKRLLDTQAVERFFVGRPESFGQKVAQLLQQDR